MADDVAQLGCRVVWEADARLIPLLARSYPTISFLPRAMPPDPGFAEPWIKVQAPAGSLGARFRREMRDFPTRSAYLFADRSKVDDVRRLISKRPGEHVVGISWLSRNAEIGQFKSIPLTAWRDVLGGRGIRAVSLQYGDAAPDIEEFNRHGGQIETFADIDMTQDIDRLAATIAACDLVITVSNTTAHLAAALGVETWVIVPPAAGKLWYWGHGGATSPWYSAAKIFRTQAKVLGADVLADVSRALTALTSGGVHSGSMP